MHVRQMYLDEGDAHSGERVTQRYAGMCISGRVDEDEINSVGAGALYAIDQLGFRIALKTVERHTQRSSLSFQFPLDARQGQGPVVLGLPTAKQIQIGAVHHEYVLSHRPSAPYMCGSAGCASSQPGEFCRK